MSMSWRDKVATLLVGAVVAVYAAWLAGWLGGVTAATVAIVVFVLGIGASMSAVVPGFAALLAGSRPYLALASLGGLVAFGAGIVTIMQADRTSLAVLVVATVLLWAAATVRHAAARSPARLSR